MERLDTLRQDLRLVIRTLVRQKAWSAVAIVTLALGIGANSALFTIINAVMLRPLPYPSADRIISISESDKGVDQVVASSPVFLEWRRSSRSFEAMAAYSSTLTIIKGTDAAEMVTGQHVSDGYFAVFGVQPARGRTFGADEYRPDAARVVILSDQLWRRAFGGAPALLGKTVSLDGTPATVIGVMPPSFTNAKRAQYWIPLRISQNPGVTFYYSVVGRLRPHASIASARTELTRISRNLDAERGAKQGESTAMLMTLQDRRYGDTHAALLVLLAAVGVLLLIACTNVANLLLARAARRQREFAVRIALGASRWRLVRYLLSESLVLSLLGGALALVIPLAATGYLVRIGPETLSRADGIQVDWTVVAFTFAVAVGTGLLFGIVPALNAGRADVRQALTDSSVRATGTRGHGWLRSALVVAELATALVLLTGAGILTKSFARVTSIDSGVRPEHILMVKVELSTTKYENERAAAQYFDQFVERVRAIPRVRSVALADAPPLAGVRMSFSTTNAVTGKPTPRIDVSGVGSTYFEMLGIRLRSGRVFSKEDRAGAPLVAVINETLARTMYDGANPLGQTMKVGRGKEARVVGVVQDVLQRGVEEASTSMVYLPAEQQEGSTAMTVLVKAAGNPSDLAPSIRRVARDLDATQPSPTFTTLEQAMSDAVAPRRFSFVLLALFASLAAVLASIGLYGVMSYLVAERTNEIGIRVALGADRGRVVNLVVGQGMRLAAIGIALGLGASVAAVRMLRQLVYQVDVYDPWTFAAGAGLLAGVALMACYIPARRATAVDPMVALRAE